MVIYWLIWFYLCLCNMLSSYKNNVGKVFLIITFLFLFIFIGFRYKVGVDWYSYLLFYELTKYTDLKSIILGVDPAYNILNYIGNILGYQDTFFVNAICGFLALFFLMKTTLKLEKYWLALLIYFPYHLLVVSMNYNRQAVAISISLWAFCKLLERRFIQFSFLIIFAALFHKTAISLLLFLPILLYTKFQQFKILNIFYIVVSLILLSIIIYYSSFQDTNVYLQGNEDMNSKGFFIRWTYHLIPLFLFYKYNYFFKKQSYYPVIHYFCILVLFMLPLGIGFSTLADRFNLYLIFFDLFVICTIFSYLSKVNKIFLLMVLILFYTMQMYLWFFHGYWAIKAWIPYQNYIYNYLFNSVF
ncbi:EpsG family protein [Acinetobacter sp. ANC 5378]|uniref:EpsG family protein n=1 Tax=Acinetobacter sp. ANC 5378 TaxID=2731249 RepID=UPI0014905EC3|nr:EpsG family protein [Acinetobacter sp. ANC 5378]NNG81648.1 EpsG family protein [Acinetobacter sp. ANC 5378]